jgi:hypothetical protein
LHARSRQVGPWPARRLELNSRSPNAQNSLVAGKNAGNFADSAVFSANPSRKSPTRRSTSARSRPRSSSSRRRSTRNTRNSPSARCTRCMGWMRGAGALLCRGGPNPWHTSLEPRIVAWDQRRSCHGVKGTGGPDPTICGGDITWTTLRDRGFENYVEVLAGLGELGLRPPVAAMEGPNVAARQRGRALIRRALKSRPA